MSLSELTALELRALLERGETSAVEVTEAAIAASEAARGLNLNITETTERAREMARASDARRASGSAGALEGIPVAIKDVFCTRGVRTTAGSRILEPFIPPYESTVTAKLWDAGAVMLGKTNCDEFAMGSGNLTSGFGPAVNPWRSAADPERALVPGGSSGGSAAAVAARAVPLSIGTDTGGSIRQPASLCGVVGAKPTYGRCSRWGIVAFASSLDQAGPFARTVRDAALLMGAMAGGDPQDATSSFRPIEDWLSACDRSIRGLRVGIPAQYSFKDDNATAELWRRGEAWLADAGAEMVPLALPHTAAALPAYYIIAPAEASSNLARYDGVRYGLRVDGDGVIDTYCLTRTAGFGAEVKRRIMIGTYALSAGYYDAYYLRAQKVRARIQQDFTDAFATVDVILAPTTPNAAFALDEELDAISMYRNDMFTVPASLAGLPAISVPVALDEAGLPRGLQLIAPAFDESTLFAAAAALEAQAAFNHRPSP